MNIPTKEAISFNLFYLIEFFNIALDKIEGKIADSHYNLLKDLSTYLLKEDTIVEGLEYIARYQTTNDLAIFLFDMMERVNDYGPQVIMNSLPDLADDFQNLYALLIEEEDNINALQKVVAEFREKYGTQEKEKQLEEFVDMVKSADETDAVSQPPIDFREFYFKELQRSISAALPGDKNAEDLKTVTDVFLDFSLTGDKDLSQFSSEVAEVSNVISKALPSDQVSASLLIKDLSRNAQDIVKAVEKLRSDASRQFTEIRDQAIIKAVEKERPAIPEKEVSDKTKLDSLLIEYFKTEVEDTVADFKAFIEKSSDTLNEPENIDSFIKKFKNLKEVSMIHGYGGLEHLSNILVQQFTDVGKKKKMIGKESVDILYDIFDDFKTVEKYVGKEQSKEQVELVKGKIKQLEASFGEPGKVKLQEDYTETVTLAEEEAPQKTEGIAALEQQVSASEVIEESAEEQELSEEFSETAESDIQAETPGAQPEPLITAQDRPAFLKVIQEFLGWLVSKIIDHHAGIREKENQDFIIYALHVLKINSNLFHPELQEKVAGPLSGIYQDLFTRDDARPALKTVEEIWISLREKTLDEIDFPALADKIANLAPAGEEGFYIYDPKSTEAFLETSDLLWKKSRDTLLRTLSESSEIDSSLAFVEILGNNLKLLGLKNYDPFVDLLRNSVTGSKENPLGKDVASEFDSAFNLFIDRIRTHGKNGDCHDIVAALKDTVSEAKTQDEKAEDEPEAEQLDEIKEEESAEQQAPEIPADEKEPEDDLSLFREETREYLKSIDNNLKEFRESGKRKHLTEIENALHSVRSAAHYLNLQDISKLAATIEEVAELFGQSDLPMPDSLDSDLRIAVETLENLITNPDTEFSATFERMESLLDNVVIEDMGGIDAQDVDTLKPKKDGISNDSRVEEKPLFASGQDEDAELLEIFKEESGSFIKNIQFHNNKLLDDPSNSAEAKEMGYAAHSLKSAAKMLGFNEISQITDGLEIITESISNGEIEHTRALHDTIEKAVKNLKDLSEGKDVDSYEIVDIVKELQPANWKELEEQETIEQEEDQIPENMVEVFVDEARELVDGLNRDYLDLEKMPESEMILSNIARRMHTLKGSAYISKYDLIGDLAHKLEDYIELYIEKDSDIKNQMLDSFFVSLDLISDMVESISQTGKEKIEDYTARLAEVDNKMFLFQNFTEGHGTQHVPAVPAARPVKAGTKKGEDESIVRISTEYMDKLVDMASELMINQTQLGAHLHSLKEILSEIEGEKKQIHGAENVLEDAIEFGALKSDEKSADPEKAEQIKKVSDNIKDVVRAVNMIHSDLNSLTEGFEQNIARISSLSKLLHSDMLKTRMVPVEQLFNRYPRAVRDIAHKQNKKVNLVIEDNNTEMDRAMVEGLSEPILHIIRNAIDHGIETPGERKALKKSETGTLILKAHQEKNQIVINIEDDGRGIDIDIIRSKIVEKGIAEKDHVEKISEAEILDYIFYPGFTTKEEATDTSGRGIGLDAVANQLQKLKGNVRIKTEKDVGTSFNIRVPLTLVVSQALMVKVNLQSIAIPVIAVQESVQYKKQDIISDNQKNYIRVRGRLLPFIHLRDILKFNEDDSYLDEKSLRLAVVIHDAGISMALGIDELVGRQEVVIKSLGSHLQNVDYISGGTILANGDVALILDYALVIRTIEMHFFGKVSEKSAVKETPKESKQTAREISKETSVEQEGKTEEKTAPVSEPVVPRKSTPSKTIKQKVITDRKPKIIVVDDSNSVRNFVGSILERSGFIAIKSTNGADALDKMKSEQVDLIITDLEMPKMHGFDFISNIRSLEKYDDLPIIILTGRAGMKHRQTGEELGANAFIVKPFKEKDLLQSLAKFIKTEDFG